MNYGNVACTLTKKDIDHFSFVFNSVFSKLFNTKDKKTIETCQYFTGILCYELYYELHRLLFIKSLINLNYLQESSECDNQVLLEYNALCNKFRIYESDSIRTIKEKVWRRFKERVDL